MYPLQALCILVAIPSICKGQQENTCNVVPKDQCIETGSDMEIFCQTSCVHSKVFWRLDNRPVSGQSRTINSSHTLLTLRNFTLNATVHSATLECLSAETQQILGGTTLRTYTKPSNISCILDYEKQTGPGGVLLICTWEHQICSSFVNYSVICPSCLPQREIICNSSVPTCTLEKANLYLGKNITIFVRAKTAARETDSKSIELNPYHILKMIRPWQVEVTSTFSDKPLVKWNRSLESRKCHCQVKYSKVTNEGTLEWVKNKTLNSTEKGEETITDVESCSYYTFAVRCALEKAPWSDWSLEKAFVTKLHKGDVRLRLWRKVTEPDKNGARKVHIMWTEIPSTCQDKFTYTIKRTPYQEHVSGVNLTNTLCGSSTCDVDVNEDAHRLYLTILQNEVLLVEDSVYVPAIGESLQVTDIQTSTLKGVILIKWKGPVQPVNGYMIDYTHNENQYHWKESKYTNATLSDLQDMKPYNITVTPLFGERTGRGTQALQICSRVGDPGNVDINSVQAYDKGASISWTVKSQETCTGVVVNYTIFYRKDHRTQKGPQLNVTVNSTKQELKDLNPDTQYRVYVQATSLTGTTTSSERLFMTKRFDPKLVTSLSVCGSITIVLVLCLGLCCAIQWKKYKEKPVPNPGLSSVARWPWTSPQKGMCSFQPISNPSESLFDRVYTEETQRTSTTSLAAGGNGNQASEQTERYPDPGLAPVPDIQNEKPPEPANTQQPSSPGESTVLLSSENGLFSPYRSQSSLETPPTGTSKQCKRLLVKQQEKTTPATVYVTLDMFK